MDHDKIFNASEEELAAMEAEAEKADTGDTSQADEPEETPEQPDKEQAQEDEPEKTDEQEPEKSEEEQPDEPRKDKHGNIITGDPVKDLKAELTRTQQERAELRRRIAEIEKEKELRSSTGDFKELTADELEDLKYDDPDKYAEYLISKREHDAKKESIEGELSHLRKEQALDMLRGNLGAFVKDRLGVDADKLKEELKNESSEIRQTLLDLDKFMTENFVPQKVVDGIPVYSTQQFDIAYRAMNPDKLEAQLRTQAREEVLAEIQRAGSGGSHLDRIHKTDNNGARSKKPDDYTAEEINQMSESEVEQLFSQFDYGD